MYVKFSMCIVIYGWQCISAIIGLQAGHVDCLAIGIVI